MGVPAERDSKYLCGALGDAVVRTWSSMPHDVQRSPVRGSCLTSRERHQRIACHLLPQKHQRTRDGLKARAILEPDSLGG